MQEEHLSVEEIKRSAETLADILFFQLQNRKVANEVIGWTAINVLFSAARERDLSPAEFQLTCKFIAGEYLNYYREYGGW